MKAIQTKYLAATNFRGSRIKAHDGDGNTITIGYPSELSFPDTHRKAADALCAKMGWSGRMVCGELRPGWMVFVFLA